MEIVYSSTLQLSLDQCSLNFSLLESHWEPINNADSKVPLPEILILSV